MISSICLIAMLYSSGARTISTGSGSDETSARKQALRNAVEQVVGAYLDSKTYVQNSILVSDSILSFSNGYVKSYDVLESSTSNGISTIKLSAIVETEKVQKRLENINLIQIAVNVTNVGAEAQTKIMKEKDKKQLLASMASEWKTDALKVAYEKMDYVRAIDDSIAVVKISYSISINGNWAAKVKTVLSQIALQIEANGKIQAFDGKDRDGSKLIEFANPAGINSGAFSESYTLNKSDFNSLIKYGFIYTWPKLFIRCKNSDGSIIASNESIDLLDGHMDVDEKNRFNINGQRPQNFLEKVSPAIRKNNTGPIFSEVGSNMIAPFVFYVSNAETWKTIVIAEGLNYPLSQEFSISPSEIGNIKTVEIGIVQNQSE